MDIFAALETFPLISDLPSDELRALAERLEVHKFSKSEYVLLHHQDSSSLYFIFDGTVRILVTEDEKETILAEFSRGDIIGEIALVSDSIRTADVLALSDTTVLELKRDGFVEHSKVHQGFGFLLMRILADRLRATSELFAETAVLNVEARLERMLIRLGEEGTTPENVPALVVSPRPTHSELASRIGTSRELVTRGLKSLEKKGAIQTEKDAFFILEE